MSFLLKKNNAKTTLALALSVEALILTVDSANKFPINGDFIVTIWNKTVYSDPSDDFNMEILKVTAVSGNVFTIIRAQEGTVAVEHALGHAVEMLITTSHFIELENEINAHVDDANIHKEMNYVSNYRAYLIDH